ncbi:hypothetical protein SAY87_025594 [Trapa incisa]|uniref:Serine-rich protein-like protein n=1 Tax=Trapa incisa TaxID=236973 RepID=A0AAN7JJP4_9MYRT|nr:hypothetical protein SAY87_025594 [Trapa incisa]
MAATTSRRTSTGPVIRLPSSSSRFYSSISSHASSRTSSGFASSTSSFATRPLVGSSFFRSSASQTHVNMFGPDAPAPSVRFSLDHSTSPSRTMLVFQRNRQMVKSGGGSKAPRRTCMCSPTTHPGSFRCSLHKNCGNSPFASASMSYSPNRLNAGRSAMTNSLVRISGVEDDLVKRALTALIRPSSHQQRRPGDFQPRPSRLSVMSRAKDS